MTKSTTIRGAKSKLRGTGRTTKKGQLIKLLGSKTGADIKTLSEQLGWQQHTTRAAVSGLRKAGYEVANEKSAKGGLSKYRILSAPTPATSTTETVATHGA